MMRCTRRKGVGWTQRHEPNNNNTGNTFRSLTPTRFQPTCAAQNVPTKHLLDAASIDITSSAGKLPSPVYTRRVIYHTSCALNDPAEEYSHYLKKFPFSSLLSHGLDNPPLECIAKASSETLWEENRMSLDTQVLYQPGR